MGRVARRGVALVALGLLSLGAPAAGAPLEGLSAAQQRTSVTSTPPARAAAAPAVPPAWTLPACTGEPVTTTLDPATHWDTVVLDPVHRLPEEWAPTDLVDVPPLGVSTDATVREFVLEPLLAMHAAAVAAGAPFDVVSGYRSQDHQDWVYHNHNATETPTPAGEPPMVAPPGHSEHQLGTTIDVIDPSDVSLTAAFATTPAGRWIAEHAASFGFVVSYPEGGEAESCYGWEPWHLRYVGVDAAREMAGSGLAPRTFLLRAAATADS